MFKTRIVSYPKQDRTVAAGNIREFEDYDVPLILFDFPHNNPRFVLHLRSWTR